MAQARITCLDCDATITEHTMTQVAVTALAKGWGREQCASAGRYDYHWVCPSHRKPSR